MRESCHHHRAGDLEHESGGNVPLQKAHGRTERTITSKSLQLVFLLRYLMSYCESNVLTLEEMPWFLVGLVREL